MANTLPRADYYLAINIQKLVFLYNWKPKEIAGFLKIFWFSLGIAV
jgi:hypothetical protein